MADSANRAPHRLKNAFPTVFQSPSLRRLFEQRGLIVWLPILGVGVLHWFAPHDVPWIHDVARRLFYLPLIAAGALGGLRGGLLAATAVLAIYTPHALMGMGMDMGTAHAPGMAHEPDMPKGGDPGSGAAKLLEMAFYVVLGAISGLLGSDRPSVTVQVGRTTLEERVEAWKVQLERKGWSSAIAGDIAERFYSVGGTTIPRVIERAEAEAGGREPDIELVWQAARELSRPEFRGLAQHVVPQFKMDDLIITDKVKDQLIHLTHYLSEQETVYFRWGANKIRARGYGIKALFTGGPGTGKSMAAEVIAGSLGLDLFRVDLSSVISRWVGGSRGEVKQAQDRFANQEVSFLLQRLEVFEGCAILTTNLQENIDEAFLRRFGAVVEFPMPTPEMRLKLWEKAIPQYAPRGDDLDLNYMANQFVLAGGGIVNSAINACILASARREPVCMRHAVEAVARELIKMGKQVSRVHFADYYEFVKHL